MNKIRYELMEGVTVLGGGSKVGLKYCVCVSAQYV